MKKLEQRIQDILDQKLTFKEVLEVIKEIKPHPQEDFIDLEGDKVFMVLMGSEYDDAYEVEQLEEPTLVVKCSSKNIAVFVTFCKMKNYFQKDVDLNLDPVISIIDELDENLRYLMEGYENGNFKEDFQSWGYNSTESCFVNNITSPWNKGH